MLRVRVALYVSVRGRVTVCEDVAVCVNGHVPENVECLHVRVKSVYVCWSLHLCFLASAVDRT